MGAADHRSAVRFPSRLDDNAGIALFEGRGSAILAGDAIPLTDPPPEPLTNVTAPWRLLDLDQRGRSAAARPRFAARSRGQAAGDRLPLLLLRVIAFALARGHLTLDSSLPSPPLRTFAPESGLETVDPLPRACERFARSLERLMASPRGRA